MRFVKFYVYNIKKIVSALHIYISFLFFAITNVNEIRAEVLFQAGKDALLSEKNRVQLDNINFIPVLEPKSEFECSQGYRHSLKEFRGNFVIMYFWATWCNNCVERLKSLYALEQELHYQNIIDVKIMPISIDFKDMDGIAAFLAANKLENVTFFKDPQKELMMGLGINNVPTAILINKQGYIINKLSGDLDWNNKYIIEKIKAMKGADQPEVFHAEKDFEKHDDQNDASGIMNQPTKPTIIN